MGEIKDFLKALSENPEARKLMQEAKEPANAEEAAALYAEIAEKTGISVTEGVGMPVLDIYWTTGDIISYGNIPTGIFPFISCHHSSLMRIPFQRYRFAVS